jgi:predicted DNA-binding ribbon-helix-helix protein
MDSAFRNGLTASNEDSNPDRHSALVMRNISVRGRRTSIRLEPQIWDTLAEICRREFCTPHDVCSYVADLKPPHGSLTSSLRVFILDYFRTSATEDGHNRAGHGQGMFLSQQRERREMRAVKADGLNRNSPDALKLSMERAKNGLGPT